MNFREAELDDLTELLELEQCVVEAERPYNKDIQAGKPIYYDMHQLITSKEIQLLLAEDSNKIVGTGYALIRKSKACLTHDKEAYLGFMYVDPEYRGQKINKQIIERLIAWSQNKGVYDFYLDVYAQNDPAIRAYQKAGFGSNMVEMKLST